MFNEADISERSFDRWRRKSGGPKVDQDRKMKGPEHEDARLRRLVPDSSLQRQVLADVASEVSPTRRLCAPSLLSLRYTFASLDPRTLRGSERAARRGIRCLLNEIWCPWRGIVDRARLTACPHGISGDTGRAAAQRAPPFSIGNPLDYRWHRQEEHDPHHCAAPERRPKEPSGLPARATQPDLGRS